MIFLTLLNNIAMLISLSIVHSLIMRRWKRGTITSQVLSGLLFGGVTIIGMLNPLRLLPGIIFDGRSIIIGIAGLFGGPITAVVTGVIAAAYRIWIGGAGIVMGVSVITESAVFGIAYHYLRRRWPSIVRLHHLLLFGVPIHLVMLILTLALPSKVSADVYAQIAIPVIIIYPIATLLVCLLFLDQESRLKAEQELARSEEKYRELVENANSIILRLTPDGRITFLNEYGQGFFGYRESELIGRPIVGALVPETDSEGRNLALVMKNVVSGAEDFAVNENEVVTRSDQRRWVRWTNKAVKDEAGRLQQILSVGSDISERKQAETELRKSEERLRRLADNVPGLVYQFYVRPNGDMGFYYVSERIKSMLGFDAPLDELYERFSAGLQSEDQQRLALSIEKVYREFTRWEFEGQYTKPGGGTMWLRGLSSPVRSGDEVVFHGVILDITERVQAEREKTRLEEQLRQSQKMEAIGLLAGGVAHDLNNLLSPIIGYVDMLLLDDGVSAEAKQSLGEILRAGERARDLVRQLMAFGRKQTLAVKVLDLNEVIREFSSLLRRTLREDIQLAFRLAPGLWRISADQGQIEQVLMNLAVNAQDATPERGVIVISTGNAEQGADFDCPIPGLAPGRYVHLVVKDTGSGMDTETQARIFEPFFTTKELGKGAGLGLATVYGIVHQHGGHIWVQSQPGQGAAFHICLPAVEAELSQPSGSTACGSLALGSGTIMVAEDEPMVRNMACAMLAGVGYQVLSAESAERCLAAAAAHPGPIELLLTDVVMPEMSGKELFARLSSQRPELKVLFMSGYTADMIAERGVLEEGVEFIQKPFTQWVLAEKVRRVLGCSQETGR